MPRPAHTLYTWSGDLGATGGIVEHWSFSLRCTGGVTPNEGGLQTHANNATDAFLLTLLQQVGSNVHLTNVTVARVGADGKWATLPSGAYDKAEWNGLGTGAIAGVAPVPAQAALVVSLATARAGASGKGRFFLPVGRLALGADGRIDAARAQTFANAAADFIGRINAIGEPVSVVSSKGFSSPVTGVRVGRVIDTMRSRRSDIPEEYVTAPVPS